MREVERAQGQAHRPRGHRRPNSDPSLALTNWLTPVSAEHTQTRGQYHGDTWQPATETTPRCPDVAFPEGWALSGPVPDPLGVPGLCGFAGIRGSGCNPRLVVSFLSLSTFGEGISSFSGPAGQVSTQMESPTQGPPMESSPWKLHGVPARHRSKWPLAGLPGAKHAVLPTGRGKGREGAPAGLDSSGTEQC